MDSIEKHYRAGNRAALAAFIIVGIAAALFIALTPRADAVTSSAAGTATSSSQSRWQAPRCLEDEVIAVGGSCRTRDDHTTRWYRVSEAGWGYWYDIRYPRALKRALKYGAAVPACHRWQMVTRWGGCVALSRADFRGGWWYRR